MVSVMPSSCTVGRARVDHGRLPIACSGDARPHGVYPRPGKRFSGSSHSRLAGEAEFAPQLLAANNASGEG